MLQATVQSYFVTNTLQDEIQSAKLNIVDNSHLSFGTVSTSLTTDYRYGLPWRTRPTGIMVDMDRLLHQTVSKDNQQKQLIKYRQMQGAQESANENLVPEKLFDGFKGISAVKALSLANDQGQTIYTITKANQTKVLPNLTEHSARTLQDVKNAVNAGLQVTISESPVYYYGWEGAGYIIIDNIKGTGAYMLEGAINGGFLKKICGKCVRKSVAGMLKNVKLLGRGIIAGIVLNEVLSVVVNYVNTLFEFTDCHKKILASVFSAIEGISMMYDALSFLRFIGLSGLMLATSAPLMMYPIVTMATMGFEKCSIETQARMVSFIQYSSRSANGKAGKTCSFETVTKFRKDGIKNSRIVSNPNTNANWFVPAKYKTDRKIPKVDKVGDDLQKLVDKYNTQWKKKPIFSVTEQKAIDKAHKDGKHWLANLLKAQAKGRWMQKQVKSDAEKRPDLSHLSFNFNKGIDITDNKTGIKYDILSGTDSNVRKHAERMNDFVWRLLKF